MGVDWTKLLAPAIVVALVFGLYLPSLDNPLVWDDTTHIERARDAPLSALFERAPGEEHFRPLVLLSYRAQLCGLLRLRRESPARTSFLSAPTI